MFLSSAKGHTSPWENTPKFDTINHQDTFVARFIYILYYVFFCALVMLADLNMFPIKINKSLKMVVSGVCCWRICVNFSHPWVTPSQTVFLQKYLAVDTAKCKNLSFTADSATFVELYHFFLPICSNWKKGLLVNCWLIFWLYVFFPSHQMISQNAEAFWSWGRMGGDSEHPFNRQPVQNGIKRY